MKGVGGTHRRPHRQGHAVMIALTRKIAFTRAVENVGRIASQRLRTASNALPFNCSDPMTDAGYRAARETFRRVTGATQHFLLVEDDRDSATVLDALATVCDRAREISYDLFFPEVAHHLVAMGVLTADEAAERLQRAVAKGEITHLEAAELVAKAAV